MDVLHFLKQPVVAPVLRPTSLVAKQGGASILILGDDRSDKVDVFQAEASTPFGPVAKTYVITAQPQKWFNRPNTMVMGFSTNSTTTVDYLTKVRKLHALLKDDAANGHVIVVFDSSEYLGKNLKEAKQLMSIGQVELVVFRDTLDKSYNDSNNVRLFERIAIFRNNIQTLEFLKKHKNVQNTLIWFNAREAKPGKYWIV